MIKITDISNRQYGTTIYNSIYIEVKSILFIMYTVYLLNSIHTLYVYNKYTVVLYIYFILRYANPTTGGIKIHKTINQLLYIWQKRSNLSYQTL